MTTASRIIKNTGYLYFKMGVTIILSLLTTRIILKSLGAVDFGVFNIVGGTIVMLGFLNSTMSNATQRFMSYTEGEGSLTKKRQVFNVTILLHLAIAIMTVLLLIIAMAPLFDSVFSIPQDRVFAAKVIYVSLLVSTFLSIINVPYEAVLNSHENMLYYSIVGIFESVLKLLIAILCAYSGKDKLIVYGILMASIPLITLSIMKIYCHKNYEECVIRPRKYWDKSVMSDISSFFGWNFLTAITSLFSAQGCGVVLNHFFGPVLNAAQGIANQINGYMSSFSGNMMKALNPVIVKRAGAGDIDSMNSITITGCKYSTYLTMLFAIPCIIVMSDLLNIWLVEVPDWAVLFCSLQLVQTIIIQTANSISTAIYAQGDIKWYAIFKGLTNLLPVILTYLSFRLGGGPYWLYIFMIVVWSIGGNIVIIHFANKNCDVSISSYIKGVVFPVLETSAIMFAAGFFISCFVPNPIMKIILCGFFTTISLLMSVVFFGATKVEKQYFSIALNSIKNKLHINR